jgi:hypothetical protein
MKMMDRNQRDDKATIEAWRKGGLRSSVEIWLGLSLAKAPKSGDVSSRLGAIRLCHIDLAARVVIHGSSLQDLNSSALLTVK